MCGIAGLTFRHTTRLEPSLVDGTLRQLAHRGPDDQGWLTLGPEGLHRGRAGPAHHAVDAALLHRRLSIIDLSAAGWQPMSTADDRFHIVHNGEIYNYLELRAELAHLGIKFRSASDTEVLLAAYAVWGPAVLPRLIGMFAFAILDAAERRLFLARDFFGIKPLYYARWRHGFAFASEIKALLQLPGVPRAVQPQALYDYLRFGLTDHGADTLFAGIRHLPPGHCLDLALDGTAEPEPCRYWELTERRRSDLSFAEAASHVRDRFLGNVQLHLRSDVPVGVALSGGIDSSSIAMAMRHLDPKLEVQTFSYVADDASVSEERWADTVVAAANTVAHKIRPSPEQLVADLDRLITVQDEPFGSTSIYAQYCVFRSAREAGIKVMLDGQGADELFAGYSTYLGARLASLLRQGRCIAAASFIGRAGELPHVRRTRFLRAAGRLLLPERWGPMARRLVREELIPRWLRPAWFRDRGVRMAAPRLSGGRDLLRAELLQAVHTRLPSLLRYEDRNSMAHSVESRVPFLTVELAEFVLSLPEEYLITGEGTGKSVLRAAMRGIVSDTILDRRDKIGFATPELRWLARMTPWVDTVLDAGTIARVPALDAGALREEWVAVLRARRPFSFRVWRWINLLRWAEIHGVSFA